MKRILLPAIALAPLAACTESASPKQATLDQPTTVCGVGPTVKGIDVSEFQGSINWTAVKNDGVVYAFIRANDGSYEDPQFATNWSGSRAAGVKHGAYHFFRPEEDAITQANALLAKIGSHLEPDDLPPVLDVEVADGIGAAGIAAGVKAWSDHVEAAIGRKPIIYVGMYFWVDNVGNPDMHTNPLWHAQYTTASCPDIASTWPTWTLWQYTSTGAVAGISGNVDVDRFNGDLTHFNAFLGPARPCGTIPAAGGKIDNGDPCYFAGGPPAGIRSVTGSGFGNNLDWTHTTNLGTEQNFADWSLQFAAAGDYEIKVYTAHQYAQSKMAKYVVTASGTKHTVSIDQTAVDGWQSLGTFTFAAGGKQSVHLGDNTGEAEATNTQLVFDAVDITPATPGSGSGSGSGSGEGLGSGNGSGSAPGGGGEVHAGCSTSGGAGGLGGLVIALGAMLRRRRR